MSGLPARNRHVEHKWNSPHDLPTWTIIREFPLQMVCESICVDYRTDGTWDRVTECPAVASDTLSDCSQIARASANIRSCCSSNFSKRWNGLYRQSIGRVTVTPVDLHIYVWTLVPVAFEWIHDTSGWAVDQWVYARFVAWRFTGTIWLSNKTWFVEWHRCGRFWKCQRWGKPRLILLHVYSRCTRIRTVKSSLFSGGQQNTGSTPQC